MSHYLCLSITFIPLLRPTVLPELSPLLPFLCSTEMGCLCRVCASKVADVGQKQLWARKGKQVCPNKTLFTKTAQ